MVQLVAEREPSTEREPKPEPTRSDATVRTHALVREALARWWETCENTVEKVVLFKDEYVRIWQKIFRALRPALGPALDEPNEVAALEAKWSGEASDDSGSMVSTAFLDGMLNLADVECGTKSSAEDIAIFLNNLHDQIAQPSEGGGAQRFWPRDGAEVDPTASLAPAPAPRDDPIRPATAPATVLRAAPLAPPSPRQQAHARFMRPTRASGARRERRSADSVWLAGTSGLSLPTSRPPLLVTAPTTPRSSNPSRRAWTFVEGAHDRAVEGGLRRPAVLRGATHWNVSKPVGDGAVMVTAWGGAMSVSPAYAGPRRRIAPAVPRLPPLELVGLS